jgi:(R,R)-butanediol dehydrogenase/meso-butanediol dehydrogenase/diacetyl reductase
VKALRFYKKNDMRLEDIPEPSPKKGEVKIKVSYAGICGTDYEEFLYGPLWVSQDAPHPLTGKKAPMVLGHEFSGRVAEVGDGVTKFKSGDKVAVYPMIYCGECSNCKRGDYFLCKNIGCVGLSCDGGFEEYCVVPERNVFKVPDDLPDEYAALAEPTGFCINTIGLTDMDMGDDVAIFGAGTIGLLCQQIAKTKGCKNVYMVARNELRLKAAKQLGADEVIDITKDDYIEKIRQLTEGEGVDCVIEATGSNQVMNQIFNVVKSGGKITLAGVFAKNSEIDLKNIVNFGRTIQGAVAHRPIHFETALKMLSDGRVNVKPLITKVVSLEDALEIGFKDYLANKKNYIKVLVKP